MKKEIIIKLLLIAGLSCLLACRLIIPSYQKEELIFQDSFSTNENNWDVWFENGQSAASIVNGEMILIVEQPNTDIISANSNSYPNIEMNVNAYKKFGSNNNVFGLVCRYLNEDNYYSFLISSDGYYGIAKMFQGNYSLLSSDMMEYTESINKDNAENVLSAVCLGNKLSFSLNDEPLVDVSDNDLRAGKNGLIVGSFEEIGELVVTFDDFSIKAR